MPPFNTEHVLPLCTGGSEKQWTLRNLPGTSGVGRRGRCEASDRLCDRIRLDRVSYKSLADVANGREKVWPCRAMDNKAIDQLVTRTELQDTKTDYVLGFLYVNFYIACVKCGWALGKGKSRKAGLIGIGVCGIYGLLFPAMGPYRMSWQRSIEEAFIKTQEWWRQNRNTALSPARPLQTLPPSNE